jgi:hypothetical protein
MSGYHQSMLKKIFLLTVALFSSMLFVPNLSQASEGAFTPIQPARLMDTRTGIGGPIQKFGPSEARSVQIAGMGSIPISATAVALNITAVNPSTQSYVTAWPSGSSRPDSSSVNFEAKQTIPNSAIVGIGTNGSVDFFNAFGTTDLVVDVMGWFSSAGFNPIQPNRIMDSRKGVGTFQAKISEGETRSLLVAGTPGIPANAPAVSLNITVTAPTKESYLTVWPKGSSKPVASSLNYAGGQTIANSVVVGVGADGYIDLNNSFGSVDIIVDITGWFPSGSLTPVQPQRLLDTRSGTCGFALSAGETRTLKVASGSPVPSSNVGAVSLNVTATSPSNESFLTIWPTGSNQPDSSNLNFVATQTIPNGVLVGVGSGGQINIRNESGTVDVLVDVTGYFDGATPTGPTVACPMPPPVILTIQPGTRLVGSEIPAGRYYMPNAVEGCYWERLSGLSGDSVDRITNDFRSFSSQVIIDIEPTDRAFKFDSDCGILKTYVQPNSPASAIAPGIWTINGEISSGTYRANALYGCYWERLSGFNGQSNDRITNDFVSTSGPIYVTLLASDVGFSTDEDCGIWTRIS